MDERRGSVIYDSRDGVYTVSTVCFNPCFNGKWSNYKKTKTHPISWVRRCFALDLTNKPN